jgi:beta-lactamase superfamily II metal-dependent hydrolase
VPETALAQDLVVTRNVTVREEPDRRSAKVDYVAPNDALELLDAGARRHGYYHVRLPDDREGWVYQTFVRREEANALVEAAGIRPDELVVHFIDVDQGNAALLEFPCAAVLIDVGGRGDAAAGHLVSYIDRFFDLRTDLHRRFAAVFVTHTHIDHNSNLRRLIDGRYQVGSYIHNGLLNGSGRADARWMVAHAPGQSPPIAVESITEEKVEAAGPNGLTDATIDPVQCSPVDPQIRVLSGGRTVNPGWSAGDFGNGNNHSVVIRVDFGEASFLFPGDLENAGIADLLRRYAGTAMLDTDVLEVSHHGAENGTTPAFLQAVSPEVAIISMGPSSIHDPWTAFAYGHPRANTVNALDQVIPRLRPAKSVPIATGARTFVDFALTRAIFATGWDGDVVLTANRSGQLAIRTDH